MTTIKNVLAISGSTRQDSSNLRLIQALAASSAGRFKVTLFEGLTDIPHFNPDLDTSSPPIQVTRFRQQLRAADGILICTPEYAMGVPGTLKNAIDWTISTMEFSRKPVALITAALSGKKAHLALQETLLIIEARITTHTQLLISFIKAKVGQNGEIADSQTAADVQALISSFEKLMDGDLHGLLAEPVLMNESV
jgi:chromate reductase